MTHQEDSAKRDLEDIENIRSEALRKVGRNVVNFARLESGLKILLASVNISGAPRELLKIRQSRIRVNRTKTLGEVASLFSCSLLREEKYPECMPEKLDGLHISLSLRIGGDTGNSQQFRNSLRKLVKERNYLLHHRLAELDSTSATSYGSLIEYLDNQQSKLLAKLDFIGDLLDLLQTSQIEFVSYLQSHLSNSPLTGDSSEAQQQDAPDPPPVSH